jgi:hypothetical protein
MTHDPLCPGIDEIGTLAHVEPGFVRNCKCDLIASVREDERKRAVFIADRTINDNRDRDDAIAWINGTPPYWWKDDTP